jgi:hypothetical protein
MRGPDNGVTIRLKRESIEGKALGGISFNLFRIEESF